MEPRKWEKIFTNPASHRGLISKIDKELKKLNTNHPNSTIKKLGTELNRILSRGTSNGQESRKEMFSVVSHQENAN